MHLVRSMVVIATLALAALAQNIAFTSWPVSLKVGEPATVTWAGGNGEVSQRYPGSRFNPSNELQPVTIILRQGDPSNLRDVKVLTEAATGGEFTWIPDADLANDANYVFQITQGDQVNYSGKIPLTGGNDNPSLHVFKEQESGIEAASASSLPSSTEVSDSPTRLPAASTSWLISSAAASSASLSATTTAFDTLNSPFTGRAPSSTFASATEAIQTDTAQHAEAPLALGMGVAALLVLL